MKINNELTIEEQILEWIHKDEVSVTRLLEIYTYHLQVKNTNYREQIAELGVLACMYREPKTNGGTKESLEKRFKEAIIQSGLFQGTEFEKKL